MKYWGITLFFIASSFADANAEVVDSLIYRHEKLDDIEILSSRVASKKILVPQQVVVCPEDFIRYSNRQNVGDMLQETGMVAVQKSQQGGGSPVIRGFEASRVLLVVDGIRMNNLIYRSGHLQNSITIDQFMLQSMEILNGPSSINYGSDALGGAVVFNTRNPKLAYDRQYLTSKNTIRHSPGSISTTHKKMIINSTNKW